MECIETMRSELCVQFQYKRDKADVIPLDEVEDTSMTMQFSHICAISHDLLSKVKYPLYSSYSVINDGSKYVCIQIRSIVNHIICYPNMYKAIISTLKPQQ